MELLRILIAEDHPIVRERLRQLLSDGFPSSLLGEAEDTTSLLKKAFAEKWDIILSDLAMPGGGGLFALEKIKENIPDIPVLIISTYPQDQYGPRVLKAGAAAFLEKDNIDETLVAAIKKILGRL